MRSKTSLPPAPHSQEGGNFGAGFFLGMMSGAVGMFLLGTKQGHKFIDVVREELSRANDRLQQPETKEAVAQITKKVKSAVKEVQESGEDWQEFFPKFQKKPKSP